VSENYKIMAPSAEVFDYRLGHQSTMLKSHSTRTTSKSDTDLTPQIKPHYRILDVGCGTGKTTLSLAKLVPNGSVVGIDFSSSAVATARQNASDEGIKNCQFKKSDAYHLYWEDNTFDMVHCNQCLIHLEDPGRVLGEMRRVCKVGGVVTARESK
jgi:ubiquinone/menaquinone biosynthesis C-methylase UbiE